jgi:predicted MFS family arabinose efflux permease
VAVLALGAFAVGTDSFVVAGILPRIGQSLHVPVGSAGMLVTVFALTYAALSPVLASATAAWPRKRLLLCGLAVLAAGNTLTALAPGYGLVLAARAVAGAGAAMYTPTASATAAALVPPARRARALAIVIAGLSAATALGAPTGTLIGSAGPWQATMWFVAALSVLAAAGITVLMPAVPALPPVGLRERLAPVRDPRVTLTLATTFLVLAGVFTVYTYIAVSYDRATGGSGTTLAALLVAWGLAATAGNLASGRLTDAFGSPRVISITVGLLLADFALMPLSSRTLPTAVIAIAVWGICGWGLLVPQQYRLIQISPQAAPLAIALNASAIYLAVSASGPIGAAGIRLAGPHQLGLISAVLILAGLAAAQAAHALITRARATAATGTERPAPAGLPHTSQSIE